MSATLLAPASPDTEARLGTLLEAVEIVSPTRIHLGGGPEIDLAAVPAMPGPGQRPPADGAEASLATAIYLVAYASVYRGGPVSPDALRGAAGGASLAAALSAANPSRTRWEPGWQVFAPGAGGAVHLRKDEVAIAAQAGQYAFAAGTGRPPAVGDAVELLLPRESLAVQPGMYHAYAETAASDYDFASIARLYFNVAADDAPWLLRTLASVLNRYALPFRIKCPVDAAGFDRTDAMVLYLGRRFLPAALRLLAPLADTLDERLRPGTPLFSLPLLAGMAGADDPGNGESFGQQRSRLVAGALLDAWRAGDASRAGRREAVARRFRAAGISPDAPHLAPGATDLYTLPGADA